MALALAAVIGWLLLAAFVVALGLLRREPAWGPWDVLRGVRALAVERLSDSLTLRLAMAAAGPEWGRRALEAGRAGAADTLTRATLLTTRQLARQLDDELRAYAEHARVLQTALPLEPLDVHVLKLAPLRTLARAERGLGACAGPITRLRLRVWTLRRALALLVERCEADARRGAAHMLAAAPDVQADLATLARATAACYATLLLSLEASRRRLEPLR